jgi:C-terminal processing protease CtpA/Prc
LIDTGASLPLLINTGTDSLLKVPEKKFSTILGYGLSGPVMGYLGKINSLENEVFDLKNMISYFQDDEYTIIGNTNDVRNGLIGNLTLSKYHIIINYFTQKLYLKPNKYYKKPTKFDLSGMSLQAFGKNFNQFIVKSVIEKGPADKAGIKVEDEILKMGFWSAWRYNLGQITERLSSKPDKIIKLKIKRGNSIIHVELKLENYL